MPNDRHADIQQVAARYFGKASETLGDLERRVLNHAVLRRPLSVDTDRRQAVERDFGQRVADRVARFGGSWTFICGFCGFLALWIIVNLAIGGRAFDAYPFIFLNLVLSMLAALQAPVIMMSQNRQAEKDRVAASHDYEVNLKAEIEIMGLHDKLDQLRDRDIMRLLAEQQSQIALLTSLVSRLGASPESGQA